MKDNKSPNLGCTSIGCIVLYIFFIIGTWQSFPGPTISLDICLGT